MEACLIALHDKDLGEVLFGDGCCNDNPSNKKEAQLEVWPKGVLGFGK